MTEGDLGNGEREDEEPASSTDAAPIVPDTADDTLELEGLAGVVPSWVNSDGEEVVWQDITDDEPARQGGDANSTEELLEVPVEEEARLTLVPSDEAEAGAAGEKPAGAGGADAQTDWHEGPSALDDFTSDDYVSATTMEYQDLAAAVRKSETETHELHAVAATMPGMDSGVVGFEDVTGTPAPEPVEQGAGDLPLRIVTGVILASLFIGALLAGGAWLMVLVAVIAVLSLGEFYAAARRVGYVPVAAFGLAGTIGTMVGGWFGGPGGIAGSIALVTMLVLLWYSVLVRRNPLENSAVTIFGLVWVGGLLGFAGSIARHPDYVALLITLVVIAASMDIGSFFVGRSMGKRKLAPVLSPKKTVEGLIGGIAVAFGVAVLAALTFEAITISGALWLALGISVMAPLGDMAESMVKRSFGIKDMGSILPGHGGFLDRIDGLLFVVPVAYYVYLALGYLD